jgi:hypothetical protein
MRLMQLHRAPGVDMLKLLAKAAVCLLNPLHICCESLHENKSLVLILVAHVSVHNCCCATDLTLG